RAPASSAGPGSRCRAPRAPRPRCRAAPGQARRLSWSRSDRQGDLADQLVAQRSVGRLLVEHLTEQLLESPDAELDVVALLVLTPGLVLPFRGLVPPVAGERVRFDELACGPVVEPHAAVERSHFPVDLLAERVREIARVRRAGQCH